MFAGARSSPVVFVYRKQKQNFSHVCIVHVYKSFRAFCSPPPPGPLRVRLGCRLKTEEKKNVTWMMMIVFRLFSAFVRAFVRSFFLRVSSLCFVIYLYVYNKEEYI
jgi:hypothetical protein